MIDDVIGVYWKLLRFFHGIAQQSDPGIVGGPPTPLSHSMAHQHKVGGSLVDTVSGPPTGDWWTDPPLPCSRAHQIKIGGTMVGHVVRHGTIGGPPTMGWWTTNRPYPATQPTNARLVVHRWPMPWWSVDHHQCTINLPLVGRVAGQRESVVHQPPLLDPRQCPLVHHQACVSGPCHGKGWLMVHQPKVSGPPTMSCLTQALLLLLRQWII